MTDMKRIGWVVKEGYNSQPHAVWLDTVGTTKEEAIGKFEALIRGYGWAHKECLWSYWQGKKRYVLVPLGIPSTTTRRI